MTMRATIRAAYIMLAMMVAHIGEPEIKLLKSIGSIRTIEFGCKNIYYACADVS